jgi:hypothetical protein
VFRGSHGTRLIQKYEMFVTALVKGVSLKGTLARKVLYYEDSKLRRRKESFSMRSRAI